MAPLVGAPHTGRSAGGGNARSPVSCWKPPAPRGAARPREPRSRAAELTGRAGERAGRRAGPAQTRAAFVPAAAPSAEAAGVVELARAPTRESRIPHRRKSPAPIKTPESQARGRGRPRDPVRTAVKNQSCCAFRPVSSLPVLKCDDSKIAKLNT